MSISYYAVPTEDPNMLGPIIEGTATGLPALDANAIRDALRRMGFAGGDNQTLRWEGENSYVFVDLCPHHVEITHGTGGGERQIEMVLDAIFVAQKNGLKVWDPQQGKWFPG